jgi:hypothetical protein
LVSKSAFFLSLTKHFFYQVHYPGWKSKWDEWIDLDSCRLCIVHSTKASHKCTDCVCVQYRDIDSGAGSIAEGCEKTHIFSRRLESKGIKSKKKLKSTRASIETEKLECSGPSFVGPGEIGEKNDDGKEGEGCIRTRSATTNKEKILPATAEEEKTPPATAEEGGTNILVSTEYQVKSCKQTQHDLAQNDGKSRNLEKPNIKFRFHKDILRTLFHPMTQIRLETDSESQSFLKLTQNHRMRRTRRLTARYNEQQISPGKHLNLDGNFEQDDKIQWICSTDLFQPDILTTCPGRMETFLGRRIRFRNRVPGSDEGILEQFDLLPNIRAMIKLQKKDTNLPYNEWSCLPDPNIDIGFRQYEKVTLCEPGDCMYLFDSCLHLNETHCNKSYFAGQKTSKLSINDLISSSEKMGASSKKRKCTQATAAAALKTASKQPPQCVQNKYEGTFTCILMIEFVYDSAIE